MDAIKREQDILEVNIVEDDDEEDHDYYAIQRETSKEQNSLKLRSLKDIASPNNGIELQGDVATGVNVSIEDWAGECDFKIDRKQLFITSDKEKASDATYSQVLDKLYCDMNKCFSIRFMLGNPIHVYDSLLIRAMVVYTSPGDLTTPVNRCPNHINASDPINRMATDQVQIESVIWGTGMYLSYERNDASGRISVVSPFGTPHAGSNYVNHIFKFTCIGSCVGGINRRPTSVIFTLETRDGKIIGRQGLNCRICSCPKRDKKNQEKAYIRQSISQNPGVQVDSVPLPLGKIKTYSAANNGKISVTPLPERSLTPSSSRNVFLVPVYGYENFVAVSKFAEYLDTVSGALDDSEYRTVKNQTMHENNRKRIKLEHEDDLQLSEPFDKE